MLFFYVKTFVMGLAFLSLNASAAQWAKVTSEKAVIYADQQKSASIGFVSKGKKVRVGEVLRHHGELLPIVINGRIAYIKIEDLNLSQSEELLASPAQRIVKKATEKTSERRFALSYNGMASSIQTTSAESETLFFNGGGIRGYITDLKKRRSWRLGIDLISATFENEDYTLDISSISAEYAINAIQTEYYDLQLYAGGSAIPYTQYARASDFKENGYGAGASVGIEMIFKSFGDVGLHIDGNYQYTQLIFPLNEAVKSDLGVDKFEPSLNGLKFSAALSFQYD